MDTATIEVLRECSKGSVEGRLVFPEVVARLAAIGCEQYHADFRRREKTYYMPDGSTHVEALPLDSPDIAEDFSADEVVNALRAIQAKQTNYMEFLARIMAAGCVGYFVYISGKRAIYLGRQGDLWVEHFPATVAAPGTATL